MTISTVFSLGLLIYRHENIPEVAIRNNCTFLDLYSNTFPVVIVLNVLCAYII